MLSLFLLQSYTALIIAQSVAVPDSAKLDPDREAEARKIKNRAELFLTACIQRDWKKASSFLSSTSPLILTDDRIAADDWLVGRLEKYEIRKIDGEDWPTAVVFGCAKLSGRGHGTYEFLMTLVTDNEERHVYHFELVHEDIESPPTKCSFPK